MLLHIVNWGIPVLSLAQPSWEMFAPLPLALPGVCWLLEGQSVFLIPCAPGRGCGFPMACEADAVNNLCRAEDQCPSATDCARGKGKDSRVWSTSKDTFQPSLDLDFSWRAGDEAYPQWWCPVSRKQAGRSAWLGWCSYSSAWGGI